MREKEEKCMTDSEGKTWRKKTAWNVWWI